MNATDVLRKVLAYSRGDGDYDFSKLPPSERNNASHDAWQEISDNIRVVLAASTPEPPSVDVEREAEKWAKERLNLIFTREPYEPAGYPDLYAAYLAGASRGRVTDERLARIMKDDIVPRIKRGEFKDQSEMIVAYARAVRDECEGRGE